MIKVEDLLSNPDMLINESKLLVDSLIDISKNNDIPCEFVDLNNKTNYGVAVVADSGNYIPFVAWLGNVTADSKYFLWANKKARHIIHNFQMPNGLFLTDYNTSKKECPKQTNYRLFDADKMSDVILGINLMYMITKDNFYLFSSRKFFDGFSKNFLSDEGYIYFGIYPSLFKIPLHIGNFSGVYIEEVLNLYEFTNEKNYLDLANRMISPWLNNEFFKSEGLFPFACTKSYLNFATKLLFKNKTSFSFETAVMTKCNTNLVDSLVSTNFILCREDINDALNKWVDNVKIKLYRDGVLYSVWSKNDKYNIHYLASERGVIDSLLEVYRLIGNNSTIEFAQALVDSILSRQTESGLIPEIVHDYDTNLLNDKMLNLSRLSTNISWLDTQNDITVTLLKIYELTNNKKYLDSALSILCGILNNHKHDNFYVEFVDTKNLEKKSYVVRTKILFLLNKLFLLADYVLKGNKIYGNRYVQNIIRDR